MMKTTFHGLAIATDVDGRETGVTGTPVQLSLDLRDHVTDCLGLALVRLEIAGQGACYVRVEDLAEAARGMARLARRRGQ